MHSVSWKLKKEHIIRSQIVFEALMIIYGGEKHIISADYLFDIKEPVYQVARRILKGERRLAPVKVTIPEGFNLQDIGNLFSTKLSSFSKDKFLLSAKDKEGYLFPDTYFFFTTDTEQNVIKSMSENFYRKTRDLGAELPSGSSAPKFREIIIMASIIEREAKGDADRGFISGILWKRLAIGMPLQADAAPETYKRKGLPASPISNPGLEAIKAAIHPESSYYLYYLHDKEGNIHYARNFEEHKANKLKYLR